MQETLFNYKNILLYNKKLYLFYKFAVLRLRKIAVFGEFCGKVRFSGNFRFCGKVSFSGIFRFSEKVFFAVFADFFGEKFIFRKSFFCGFFAFFGGKFLFSEKVFSGNFADFFGKFRAEISVFLRKISGKF